MGYAYVSHFMAVFQHPPPPPPRLHLTHPALPAHLLRRLSGRRCGRHRRPSLLPVLRQFILGLELSVSGGGGRRLEVGGRGRRRPGAHVAALVPRQLRLTEDRRPRGQVRHAQLADDTAAVR